MVGAYSAPFAHAGFGADFWATIAPHGVIELSAIQIAGGAGLVMAGGYLRPGRGRRRDALVRRRTAGRDADDRRGADALRGRHDRGLHLPAAAADPGAGAIGAITALVMVAYFAGRRATPIASRCRHRSDGPYTRER